MIKKFLYFFQYSFIFLILLFNYAYGADVTITGTTTTQTNLQEDSTLTIQSGGTLVNTNQNNIARGYIAAGNEIDGATVVVESNASIKGKSNTIMGRETDNLTITNSGIISASSSKAINLRDAQNTTITNKKGGTISANTNAIVGQSAGVENAENVTISNSGTISSVENRSIYFYGGSSTNTTLTNNSSGVIYNTSDFTTIQLDTNSTLTNSGTIENRNSPSNGSITVVGNNNTITLKDGGKVVGTIVTGSTTGNTLKIQHGVGQSYFYETSGNAMTLQDLDGNQIVQGSAGSVGQGGNENIDELLGYKSLNIRNSLNKFLKSEGFKNKKTEWQGIQATSLERKENSQNLALGYDFYSLGVNIFRPLENENVIASFEYSEQDFQKDHNIKRYNVLFGLHYNESENKFKDNSFILAGATINESERKILTNTTSSGTLKINDTYESFEIHTGKKFQNKSLLPNFGTNLSYSFTPPHAESKFYSWEKKHVANFSLDISDEYNIESKNKKNKLNIGWILDYRTLIGDSKTEYSVNGTKAKYHQDDDLTKEMTLSVDISYEKIFDQFGKILLSIDGKTTTQDVNSIGANIYYVKVL